MINKSFVFVILFTMIAGVCSAQRETRNVGQFDRIRVSNNVEVLIKEGNSPNIEIEVNRDALWKWLKVEVNQGELRLGIENEGMKKVRNAKVKVTISADNLSAIKGTSGGYVHNTGTLSSKEIALQVTSGAAIELELAAGNVSCDATSGSSIQLQGTANHADVSTSSGSVIKMGNLVAKTASAHASSGSSIRLHVTEDLKASASSGSSITYKGDPKIDRRQSSGGSVRRVN